MSQRPPNTGQPPGFSGAPPWGVAGKRLGLWVAGPDTHLKVLLDHLVADPQVPLTGPRVAEAARAHVDVEKTGHLLHLRVERDTEPGEE